MLHFQPKELLARTESATLLAGRLPVLSSAFRIERWMQVVTVWETQCTVANEEQVSSMYTIMDTVEKSLHEQRGQEQCVHNS